MAPEDPPVVVDTNIIFSALLSAESPFREVLFTSPRRFLICETTIVDLFRLKDKLRSLRPNLSDEVLSQMLHAILRRVNCSAKPKSRKRAGMPPSSCAAAWTSTTPRKSR